MKKILSNVWLKRCVSVFCVAYAAVITLLTYATFLYDLVFVPGKQSSFFMVLAVTSLIFMVLMIYTREMFVTRLISVTLLPVVFFLLLFNIANQNWILIIPPFIVALVIFFAAGTGETVKVIMGTIYLLLYVLGIVVYVVCNMLLVGSTVETPLDMTLTPEATSVYSLYKNDLVHLSEVVDEKNTISPDGRYRFYLTDVKNSGAGEVRIYVVPNGQDIKLKFFSLNQKGIRKTITNKGVRGVVPDVGWTEKTREDGKKEYALVYLLTPQDSWRESSVTSMPTKKYWEFLGF